MELARAVLPHRSALLSPDAGGWRRRQLAGWAFPRFPVCLGSSCQGQMYLWAASVTPACALLSLSQRGSLTLRGSGVPLTRAPLSPWQGGR